MRHAVALLGLCAVVVAAQPVSGQAIVSTSQAVQGPLTAPYDGPKPQFEVAAVRPNTGPAAGMSMSSPPGRFTMTGLPLQMLLTLAYRLRSDQTEGVPDWVKSSRFDINAKMPDGAPQEQLVYMVQSLLESRFKLKWHTETREADVYALVVAREDGRLGPKLKKSDVDCKPIVEKRQAALKEAMQQARGTEEQRAILEKLLPKPGEPMMCNTRMSGAPTPGGSMAMRLQAAGMEISNLIGLISGLAGRPVVDRTNLTGGFDFEFTFSPMTRALTTALPAAPGLSTGLGAPAQPSAPAGLAAPVPSAVDDSPTIFQALEEQLGLKLQSARGPVEYFIVDSIQQPEPD